jgi:ubiquinone/menaquinone biosynthesis C-methylase UbiE
MAPRFIASQLSYPRGLGGWLVRLGMNRGNAGINSFLIDQMVLDKTDEVLEIGFGGGPNIRRFVDEAASFVGVDRSADVVKAAERRFAADRARASFVVADVENLPFADGRFSKAATVHTVYFWTSLDRGFHALHRTLRPGGLLAVGFMPKARMDTMRMPADIFTSRDPDSLRAAAAGAGFSVELRAGPPPAPWLVMLCRKASAA